MNKFYISDLHFGHYNIIKMCNRPFSSLEEMHETLITNWNKKVKPNDEVYILGDIFLKCDIKEVKEILSKLKGKKYLIQGNHEHYLNQIIWKDYFEKVSSYMEINDNGRKVILFHYPIEEWNGYYRDSYHLYGHVHNNPADVKKHERKFNVGVELNDYTPQTLDELIERNKKKEE